MQSITISINFQLPRYFIKNILKICRLVTILLSRLFQMDAERDDGHNFSRAIRSGLKFYFTQEMKHLEGVALHLIATGRKRRYFL